MKLLVYTLDDCAMFGYNMKLNHLDCTHFTPAAVRYENRWGKIDIDHTGLTAWQFQEINNDPSCDKGEWLQAYDCEKIHSLRHALGLLYQASILQKFEEEIPVEYESN